jgi:tripartite-type tricarboxylate transporter receptor subunit TctC
VVHGRGPGDHCYRRAARRDGRPQAWYIAAAVPPELVARIHDDVSKALDLPKTKHFFQTNSLQRVDLSPQDVGKLVQSDLEHWSALIKAVGVKID